MNDFLKELEFKKMPPDKKYYSVVPGLLKRIKNLYENIYSEFGISGLEMIRRNSDDYGREIGLKLKERQDLKGVRQVGSLLLKIFDNITENWEVTHLDDKKMIIAVPKCPYPFEIVEICKAHIQMERSLVETLDDSLDYKVGKCIPAGDGYCEHILEVKSILNRS
jgi:hypothetical protein